MPAFSAIGLGEILWDILPDGKKLGGAPANFAFHVNALGGVGIPVSRIGNDELGQQTLVELEKRAVSTEQIFIDPDHPTGTVDAVIDDNGAATYVFPDDVAWDYLAFDGQSHSLAAQADAICFGTLAQRCPASRSAIYSFLQAAPSALKVYDINLRQDFYGEERIHTSLTMADVLKINDEELQVVTDLFGLPENEPAALKELLARYDLKLAVLTRGADGSYISTPDAHSDLSGDSVNVVDTIGAGDSFTAALVLSYLFGKSLDEMHRHATEVAAFVCQHAGGMPDLPESLRIR